MPNVGDVLATAFVPGAPKTKGSLDFVPGRKCRCCPACNAHLPGGHAKEGVIGSKRWRTLMAEAIRGSQQRLGVSTYDGAVTVVASYYLPVASVIAVRAGDLDKLLRNSLDAFEDAHLYGNDVQVVRVIMDKFEAGPERPKGLGLVVFAGRV